MVFLLVMNSIGALHLENLELVRLIVADRGELARARPRRPREPWATAMATRPPPASRRLAMAQEGLYLLAVLCMSLQVLSPREASIFAVAHRRRRDARAAAAARGRATDAVAGFDAWLARAPQANRAAIRASLLGLGTRLRGRDCAGRAEALRTTRTTRAPGVPQLMEALRAAAAAAYYGDDDFMRRLGSIIGQRGLGAAR